MMPIRPIEERRAPLATDADTDVVVVGAGPTGMMLALELARGGVKVMVLEARRWDDGGGIRALGLHAGTLALLDQRGMVEAFLEAGRAAQVQSFGMIPLDISDFPVRHPYGLALPQPETERLLASELETHRIEVHWEHLVTGVVDDDEVATVHLSGGGTIAARYVVGCDGGRSTLRRAAGIDFVGEEPSVRSLVAELTFAETPPLGVVRDERGQHGIGPIDDGYYRMVVTGPYHEDAGSFEPSLETLRHMMCDVWGSDFGAQSPRWLSSFTDRTKHAAAYRRGRVFLAGDSAHVHYPVGGQGLNLGIADAVNLGWKLAQVCRGEANEPLLDSYHTERHGAVEEILVATMAQTALLRGDARTNALRGMLAALLCVDPARRQIAGLLSGLGTRYDLGGDHPLIGRRFPELMCENSGRPKRLAELLHSARWVLVSPTDGPIDALRDLHDDVVVERAELVGRWQVPILGEVEAARAMLIRPDGYVAWVGDHSDEALREVCSTWVRRVH